MHMPLYLWYHIHTWALILPLSDFKKHVRQTIIWDHPNQSPQHTAWVWNISWTYVTPGKGLSLGGLAPRFAEERNLKCRCAIHCMQTWGKVDQALLWFCRLIPENLRGRNKVSICKCHELEIIWNVLYAHAKKPRQRGQLCLDLFSLLLQLLQVSTLAVHRGNFDLHCCICRNTHLK